MDVIAKLFKLSGYDVSAFGFYTFLGNFQDFSNIIYSIEYLLLLQASLSTKTKTQFTL